MTTTKRFLQFLSKDHKSSLIRFGVLLIALNLFQPAGVVSLLVSTYGFQSEMFGIAIIAGLFVRRFAQNNVWLQLIAAIPYSIYLILIWSLWWRGLSPILAAQILYTILWLLMLDGTKTKLTTAALRRWFGEHS